MARSPRLPDPRLVAALAAAKVAGAGIRRVGRGGGTAAPGLVADRIDPELLRKLAARLDRGAIVVAGTNGKTTTSRMVADILEADGLRVAHNRSGSNLVRGVVSALAERASVGGDPRADAAVIETDEAAFPEIVRLLQPRVILLNNLFRDQLDRYGELNTIATKWRTALERLPAATTVVVNGDDPTLAAISEGIAARRVAFGLDDPNPLFHLAAVPHAADATVCRACGRDLAYATLYSAHLGDWRCDGCGRRRPELDVVGRGIVLEGVDALRVTVERRGDRPASLPLRVAVPGLYNVYNTVAAVAATSTFGVPDAAIERATADFRSAFGRIERVSSRGRTIVIALVKNPGGFNETLRMLTVGTGGLDVPTLIAINDLTADGREVSWLWVVDFELLATGDGPLYTTGLRGTDMANRLKYAGVPAARLHPLEDDLARGLQAFVEQVPEGQVGYVLPTYTAMLGLRRTLADLGAVESFWRQ